MPYKFNPFTGTFDDSTTGPAGTVSAAGSGTAALPGIAFSADPNTGIYSPGADQLAISTNGTGRLTVDATGNVNIDSSTLYVDAVNNRIGVGTTGPVTKFDIRDPSEVGITIGTTSTPYGRFYTDGTITTLLGLNNSPLVFSTNSGTAFAERMRITAAGLVGLGTSSPGATLHVSGSGEIAATVGSVYPLTLWTSTAAVEPAIYTKSGSALRFGTTTDGIAAAGFTERVRITSAGNVGIGTTSPGAVFHVTSADDAKTAIIAGASGRIRSLGYLASFNASVIEAVNSSEVLYAPLLVNGSQLLFGIERTERARIDSSGRLLVGTSSQSGGSLLQVNDNRIRIATAKTPASATDTGVAGEICWDANYVYVCTATNTWKRTAISTW